MAASRIKQPPVEFLNRKPIPPRFETVMPGDQSRLPINELTKVDPINSRLQNLSRILTKEYQCFRLANGGPDSFFQAFGVALLEHYARKTTDIVEIEDFRKWIKAQVNGTQVRYEAEEEYKLFLRLIGILSQDKRENFLYKCVFSETKNPERYGGHSTMGDARPLGHLRGGLPAVINGCNLSLWHKWDLWLGALSPSAHFRNNAACNFGF